MVKNKPLETDLIGTKTTKTDERVIFLGMVDELSSNIMLLTHYMDNADIIADLTQLVKSLFVLSAEVAGAKKSIGDDELGWLIGIVKKHETGKELKGFVLPGTTMMGARIHVVRTIARRAELAFAKIFERFGGSLHIFEYLNKVSTLLFALGRKYDESK